MKTITIPISQIAIDGKLSELLHNLECRVRNLGPGSNFEEIQKVLIKIDIARNLPDKEYKIDQLVVKAKDE